MADYKKLMSGGSPRANGNIAPAFHEMEQVMTEYFKAYFDRLCRCNAVHNRFLAEKRCVLIACAGGTGRGTLE